MAQLLAARPALSAMPSAQIRVIVSMRMVLWAWQNKQNPRPYLAKQLGDGIAAGHLVHVVEMMAECWPEPVFAHAPCCSGTSYDEMLLIDLVTAVVRGETEHFHGLLGEMIGRSDRQKLHLGLVKFASRFGREGRLQ